jgi:multidrug efflux pump
MDEITGALVGIVLVLTAVFLPMSFFSGSTGVIFRQFAVTIVSALILSVIVALVLTPALCATLLKAPKKGHAKKKGFFGWFNRTFDKGVKKYEGGLRGMLKLWIPFSAVFLAIVVVMGVMFVRLPSGFLPDEDQGLILTIIQLPPGATQQRTMDVIKKVEHQYLVADKKDIKGVFCVGGFSIAGQSLNAGECFTSLVDFKYRGAKADKAPAIAARAMGAFAQVNDAVIFPVIPPALIELGNATGFDLELEDKGGLGQAALTKAQNQLVAMAGKDPSLQAVRANGLPDVPQLQVDVDQDRATTLGVAVADVNATLGTAWGSTYINDFIDRGRIKRVYAQIDDQYRSQPADLSRLYVRGTTGTMAPFSSFATSHWTYGPAQLQSYNGNASAEILGQPVPGASSGAAMEKMVKLVGKLPKGIGYEWTGLSYEENTSGGQAPALYGLSVLVVFLALAALYESWAVPLAVLLVLPLGIIGAVVAVTLRGLTNDVYFEVGLLTTMGLAAKNAILIIEFAEAGYRDGKSALEAAIEGAKLRLRPILMTSIAFIVGVAPLAVSNGAGSGSQNDIGTGVIGGMFSATVLAIFFVPLFYLVVRKAFKTRPLGAETKPKDGSTDEPAEQGA